MDMEMVVREAWDELLLWVDEKRLKPENEEEIQCFLYYGIVKRIGDATLVKPKPTTNKPDKLKFSEGKLLTENMHFPDLVLGAGGEVIIEIKFARDKRAGKIYDGCKRDLIKMKKQHSGAKRFFVLYDVCEENIFLSERQAQELQGLDEDCVILFYPKKLNTSPRKDAARQANKTLIDRGYNFKAQGKLSAAKAIGKTSERLCDAGTHSTSAHPDPLTDPE